MSPKFITKITTVLLFSILAMSCSKDDPAKDPVVTPPVVTPPSSVDPAKEPVYTYSSEIFPVIDWSTPKSTGPVYYVSGTTGDDSRDLEAVKNPKTPWKTIQKAANSISGGATVIISGGVYNEKVVITNTCSGSASSQTIFRNKYNEEVIIDGGIVNTNEAIKRFVYQVQVKSANYVTIKGIQVKNVNWYGIGAEESNNVTIENCTTINSGASGIYGRLCNNLSAIGNKVSKACQVLTRDASGNGTQECITFAGVQGFRLSYNEVSDSEVGDGAGGEGIDAKGGSSNGEMSKNFVHDIQALGLYIDAGSFGSGLSCGNGSKPAMNNIRVFGNKVFRTNGVRVAGELGGHADHIYFYNNIIKESIKTGFVFNVPGKFECSGTVFPNSEVGKFTNVYIVNNTFYNDGVNSTGSSNFVGSIVSFNRNPENDNVVIKNNIIYSASNAKLSLSLVEKKGFIFSNNLFFNFKPGGNYATVVKGVDFEGDPLFKNATAGDFTLLPSSPAKDKGVPIMVNGILLFSTDMKGVSRGGSWDIGAFEL